MHRSWQVMALGICFLLARPLVALDLTTDTWWAVRTIAGDGTSGDSGDEGPGTGAKLITPTDVTVDALGNVYIADTGANRIRRVSPAGIITTFAGTGTPDSTGDGGPAISAKLNAPQGVGYDRSLGRLYIADTGNNRVRFVTSNGDIGRWAGTGVSGFSGDSGTPTAAQLSGPVSVAVDSLGGVAIYDAGNYRVRFSPAPSGPTSGPTGTITTLVGYGSQGYSGDGSSATNAAVSGTGAIAVRGSMSGPTRRIWLADAGNDRVRLVSDYSIASFAGGDTVRSLRGDLGAASLAALNNPTGVAFDSLGNIYIADSGNGRIRVVNQADGTITTVAGGGISTGEDVNPLLAALVNPTRIAVGPDGSIYFTEPSAHRVRVIYRRPTHVAQASTPDFDNSGTVNTADLDTLMHHMGQLAVSENDPGRRFDLDGSGTVGSGDAFIVMDNLGSNAAGAVVPVPPGPGVGPYANAEASVSMAPTTLTSVGRDSTITITFSGTALNRVKQLGMVIEYYPPGVFD